MIYAAAISIVWDGPRVLCVWNKKLEGWGLPGGKVEEGETLVEAQARELSEETGLMTLESHRIYLGRSPYDKKFMIAVFEVTPFQSRDSAHGREEGCPVEWMTPETLLKTGLFPNFYRSIFSMLGRMTNTEEQEAPHGR